MSLKRDLELMYELGALRLIPRQWQRFHLPNVANLAEHHFRVAWLALLIAAREDQGDTGKILKMALAHDIAESRTGDVDYLARQYVIRQEDQAIKDMLKDTALEKEFQDILEEYERRESIEAKIVKDADNLDVDMELCEQAALGNRLPSDKAWRYKRNVVYRTKLYTPTAKKLYKAIWSSNPHDWHSNSPANRINGGDWKQT